jgi:hypothetical protein
MMWFKAKLRAQLDTSILDLVEKTANTKLKTLDAVYCALSDRIARQHSAPRADVVKVLKFCKIQLFIMLLIASVLQHAACGHASTTFVTNFKKNMMFIFWIFPYLVKLNECKL